MRTSSIIELVALLVAKAIWPLVPVQAGDGIEMGPLAYETKLTLETGDRFEVLGPLLRYEQRDLQRLWSVNPLFSRQIDEGTDSAEFDFLYPLLTYDRYGTEHRFQIFQLFNFGGGQNQAGEDQSRFTIFPFYFQQRSTDPGLNYTAFLPFYGSLKNRLFRDEIQFVLWPFYVQTRKKDVITRNSPFPFFHLREGDGLSGWQLWPITGFERKGATLRTNVLEEVETVGGHEKFFALWPFYFNDHLGIGTENPQRVRVFLPFYSFHRSPRRDSSTYLWPFFTFTDDREKKYPRFDLAGPLVVFARGEGKTGNRIWPLFSQVQSAHLQSRFYLWPVYKYNRIDSAPLDRRRTRILFFLYSDLVEQNTETGEALRRKDFWPWYTDRRDLNGNRRLQILSLWEPLLPNNKSLERNYSPLWSLWRSEHNAQTGASSQSFLWNLYRGDQTPEAKKCSLFFGLFQYQSDAEGKGWRIGPVRAGKMKAKVQTRAQP